MKNIAIVTPSYLIKKKSDHDKGIRQLEKQGYRVLNPEFVRKLPTPQAKAEQLHAAFSDPNVDIVLAQRGGYSAMKVLPHLDFELIGKHPKILAGFSDLTALLNPIYDRTGLVTLHAPMVINLHDPTEFTLKSFQNALQGFPEKNLFRGAPVKVYHHGKASGVLKGGNLTTMSALIDTDWDVNLEGAIVFLEDVDEKLYRVDRYLTQWILAGKFSGVQALILGDFGLKSRAVYHILASQMEISIPVVHCPFIGHVLNMITLPIGAGVEIDTNKKSLVITSIATPGGVG
ncbi:LD-carboxypeptidase [Geomonas sp.]|uniref:S66 peptidase family protein n=1 Tax=Geomonas sp. TaxID=2651584 RepID=UPI002B491D2C|nr:LD-carboxypeptidase [Geomonas sp.]HJV33633.1 LD-carboxypeptidase [Geomonas sp.]